MKTKLMLLIAAFGLAAVSGRAQIYSADFSNTIGFDHNNAGSPPAAGPQSLSGGVAGSGWTIGYDTTPATDASGNVFGTDGDSMFSTDFGGEGYFFTETIDVSGWNEISIVTIAESVGSDPVNADGEFFQFSYDLDGGSPVTGTLFNNLHPSDPIPSGFDYSQNWASVDTTGVDNLVVRFSFNSNGSGDGFDVSSITVNGITAIPEPSTIVLVGLTGLAGFAAYRRRNRK